MVNNMRTLVRASLFTVLISVHAAPARASRAELDGRGLPHLLAIDPSNILLFPGSARLFSDNALLDYTGYSFHMFDYYDYWRYAPPPSFSSLVQPVSRTSENFALALAGKKFVFGYVLDGLTHNLVIAHRSGWGASLGISDQYHEEQDEVDQLNGQLSTYRTSAVEVSRRDVRLALGWSKQTSSGRSFELGVGADFVNTQFSTSTSSTDVDTTVYEYKEWKSEPGIGFDVRVRTLNPASGFQGALRFAYEDLQPDVIAGPPAGWIRRYALSEFGWRGPFHELDDLAVGIVLEWSHDTVHGLDNDENYSSTAFENTRYFGQVFASAEHQIVGALLGRAGVHGNAYFERAERLYVNTDENSYSISATKDSNGAIQNPEFFLGLGWTWKRFQLDGTLRENVSLSDPFSQWSIKYAW
jgi:hypothetical protein